MSSPNHYIQKWLKVASLSIMLILMAVLMGNPFATDVVKAEEPTEAAGPDNRPNIVIFMADDMGYTDVGAFGSEIPTPNIDSLATNGMMMTNFHTMSSCSPTRLELLTGVDNHRGGFGTMGSQLHPTQVGQPGYETVINDRVVTIPTLLRESGYHTFMAGKWHMGNEGGEGEDANFWPDDRGFEKSFALLPGAASHFSDRLGFSKGRPFADYIEDGVLIPEENGLPEDFYSTYFYTNKIISYTQTITDGAPFYAYFAYTAPHGPLHVPADDTYVDEILSDTMTYNYQAGWDDLRQRRFDRMKELGILDNDLELPPRWTSDPLGNPIQAWDDLDAETQAFEAKRMAIYAAMIRHLDDEIGRFIQYLKDTGEYDNTIFVFFGDNGADDLDRTTHPAYVNWFNQIGIDNSYENIGNVHSFIVMGAPWAQVSSTPFWGAKATVAEGGIRNSFLVSYQGADANNPIIQPGSRSDALATILDLGATYLDYASIEHPGVEDPGEGEVFQLDGRSLRSVWEGTADYAYGPDDYIGFELFGTTNKALISGDGWKVLRLGDAPWGDEGIVHESDQNWKLFNLNEDPGEQHNLAAEYPDRFRDMQARYRAYEAEVGFVSAYLRDAGEPGQSVSYNFDVTNYNPVTDTFELGCSDISPWPCDIQIPEGSHALTLPPTLTLTVLPFESVPVTLTIDIPADVEPDGERYVTEVYIESENNPRSSLAYTVITFAGEVGSASVGAEANYTLNISNSTDMTDTFALDCASAWACDLMEAGANRDLSVTLPPTLTVTVGAGESTQVDIMITVPASAEEGTFDIARVTSTSQNTSETTVRAYLTSVDNTPTAIDLTTFNSQNSKNSLLYGAMLMLTMMAGYTLWRRRK